MTKLRDLKDGDKVRLVYRHEGTVRIAYAGEAHSHIQLLDENGDSSFSCDYDEDGYGDLTVELLEKAPPAVGDEVSLVANLPPGTVLRYVNVIGAQPVFKTMDGFACIDGGFIDPGFYLGGLGDVYRIEYLPE